MPITDLIPWKREGNKVPVRQERGLSLYDWERDVNRLFDDFFRGWGLAPFGAWEPWEGFSPRVDVVETDREFRVSAELPGMDERDVEVSISHNTLTIRGEKRAEKEDRGENYYHVERSYGSFHRSIPFPCEVDADKANAVFKKGVLTVTLPKVTPGKECKKIDIKVK